MVDVLFGGNQYLVKPQFGRYDALPLSIRLGTPAGDAREIIQIPLLTQVRNIKKLQVQNRQYIMVANNDDYIQAFRLKEV